MKFIFTAADEKGSIHKGMSGLSSRSAVIESLQRQGLTVISVEEYKNPAAILTEPRFGWVSHVDKMLFTKHLSVMLKAGLTLLDALKSLAGQTKSRRFKTVLSKVLLNIEQGQSFHKALSTHPKIFSSFYVNIVKAGEYAGTLQENLAHLADQYIKDHNLLKKVKSAMMYPVIVFGAALIIGFFFATYVLPQVANIFSGLQNIEMPLVTRGLLSMSEFVREHTLVSFVGFVGSIYFIYWFIRRKFLAPFTHHLILRLPIIGRISHDVNMARFSLILGTMLRSGIDIVQALDITREVINNIYYKRAIAEAHLDMQRGTTLHESLMRNADLFPPVVLQMIEVGERSGELEEVLKYLAEFYELEVETTTKDLSSVLEPVLLLLIGLVALGLAYAILIPIYNYTSAIQSI
jgi:type IV pilus assembly protein PilC